MFAGLDRDSYDALGDAVVGPIRAHTHLRWIGFYLAHGATAAASTWTTRRPRTPEASTWRFLHSEGWGVAPIFLGRQFLPGGVANPAWTDANGQVDGAHAVALATSSSPGNLVDIERGATIYLDLEADGFLSVPAARSYIGGWCAAVRSAGYRPGLYLSYSLAVHPSWTTDGLLVRSLFPDVAVWYFRIPGVQPQVYDEASGVATLPDISNFRDPDGTLLWFGFVASQFAWYNPSRAFHSARLKTGPSTFFTLGPIDFDAARMPDPSHPEDRSALTFSDFRPGEPAIVSLSHDAAAWQYHDGLWGQWGQAVCLPADTPMNDLGYGRWYDTRSVAAASRQPGLLDVFGVGIDGSAWTSWRSPDVGGADGLWTSSPQLIAAPGSLRHGSPIAAVSRKLDTFDVFFFNTSHELATTWWHPTDTNWQGHVGPVTHGFTFAPGSNICAVRSGQDPERIDVFAIDSSNVVRWVVWQASTGWRDTTVATSGAADPFLGVHAEWFGGRLHVLVGMRDKTIVHLSQAVGGFGTPWQQHGVLPSLGSFVRPMGLALAATDAALVAVVVGSNQVLAWAGFDGSAWGPPGFDAATPAYSASGRIAAHRFDGTSVDVALPNHDATIVTRRLTLIPGLTALAMTGAWEMIL